MHWTIFARLSAVIVLMVIPVRSSLASPAAVKQYHVLRLTDYEAITGCAGLGWSDYAWPLQSSLHFLVFADLEGEKPNTDLHYARRHTLPLLRNLRTGYAGPDGAVARRCVPPALRRILFALKLLDANGDFGVTPTPGVDFVYDPAVLEIDRVSPKAFPVLSRQDYMAKSGCKASRKNYARYHLAFEWVVFKAGYPDRARAAMAKFLDVLYAQTPTHDGYVDQRCLIPAIGRIASELDLLDEKGRYRVKK